MTSAAATLPARPSLGARARALVRRVPAFRLGVAAVALHVIDDAFVQPQPGTSASDHLVAGVVPLALLALVAWAYPRVRGGRRSALALALGLLGLAAGGGAFYYGRTTGLSGDDYTGLLALGAGLALIGGGAIASWRARRTDGTLRRRIARRVGWAWPAPSRSSSSCCRSGWSTSRRMSPAPSCRRPTSARRTRTSDSPRATAWSCTAVRAVAQRRRRHRLPGAQGPAAHARMLVRHGYGVLLFDRRGEGESDGDPNAWGWGGDRDLQAAIAWLAARPDVDPAASAGSACRSAAS